jgi:hypothetical protein
MKKIISIQQIFLCNHDSDSDCRVKLFVEWDYLPLDRGARGHTHLRLDLVLKFWILQREEKLSWSVQCELPLSS